MTSPRRFNVDPILAALANGENKIVGLSLMTTDGPHVIPFAIGEWVWVQDRPVQVQGFRIKDQRGYQMLVEMIDSAGPREVWVDAVWVQKLNQSVAA